MGTKEEQTSLCIHEVGSASVYSLLTLYLGSIEMDSVVSCVIREFYVSDCRSRGYEFDDGLVPYYGHSPPFS